MNAAPVNHTPNFQAKFLYSESLKMIADYTVERGKFERLNNSRKNISKHYLKHRIRVDIGEKTGKPFIAFTHFIPKPEVITPASMNDFIIGKTVVLQCEQYKNVLKYALEKVVKLGNNDTNNKLFKQVMSS